MVIAFLASFLVFSCCISLFYKPLFNPVIFSYVSTQTPVLAGSLWIALNPDIEPPSDIVIVLAFVYLVGSFFGAILGHSFTKPMLLFVDSCIAAPTTIPCLTLSSCSCTRASRMLALVAFFLFLFLFIFVDSNWLYSPRIAYMRREGIGIVWSFLGFAISVSFVYRIFYLTRRAAHGAEPVFRNIGGITLTLILYIIASFFTGSKQNSIALILVAIFYISLFKKISALVYLAALLCLIGLFSLLLSVSSGFSFGTFQFLSYFDHLWVTSNALEIINNMPFSLGDISLSGLWAYVPRALYPAKPLLSGASVFLEDLFPGGAAAGYTPAFLSWLGDYADFGIFGVFFTGFFAFAWIAGSYKALLSRRSSIFLFLINSGNAFMIFNFPSYWIGFCTSFAVEIIRSFTGRKRRERLLDLATEKVNV